MIKKRKRNKTIGVICTLLPSSDIGGYTEHSLRTVQICQYVIIDFLVTIVPVPWFWSIHWRHILDKFQFVVLFMNRCTNTRVPVSVPLVVWDIRLTAEFGLVEYSPTACRVYSGTTACYWKYMQFKIRDLMGCLCAMRYDVFIRWVSLPLPLPFSHALSPFSSCLMRGTWEVARCRYRGCLYPVVLGRMQRIEWQEGLLLDAVVEDLHVKMRRKKKKGIPEFA